MFGSTKLSSENIPSVFNFKSLPKTQPKKSLPTSAFVATTAASNPTTPPPVSATQTQSKAMIATEPIKLCIKRGEYSVPDSNNEPIAFYSVAPDVSKLTTDITELLLELTTVFYALSLEQKVVAIPTQSNTFNLNIRISIFKKKSKDYFNVEVDFREINGLFEAPEFTQKHRLLVDKLIQYLLNKIYNETTLLFYLRNHLKHNKYFYVTFDFSKKRMASAVVKELHRDKTDFIILSLFRENIKSCEIVETTPVALSPNDLMLIASGYRPLTDKTDIEINDKLTEIYKKNPLQTPSFFRFPLKNCNNNTIIIKDNICVHKGPPISSHSMDVNRPRDMFRFKFGVEPFHLSVDQVMNNSYVDDKTHYSYFTYTFPVSDFKSSDQITYSVLEISINNPFDPDGLFTFNTELQTGIIPVGRNNVSVLGDFGGKKSKNQKRKTKNEKRKNTRKNI